MSFNSNIQLILDETNARQDYQVTKIDVTKIIDIYSQGLAKKIYLPCNGLENNDNYFVIMNYIARYANVYGATVEVVVNSLCKLLGENKIIIGPDPNGSKLEKIPAFLSMVSTPVWIGIAVIAGGIYYLTTKK